MIDIIVWFVCLSAIAFGVFLIGTTIDRYLTQDDEFDYDEDQFADEYETYDAD